MCSFVLVSFSRDSVLSYRRLSSKTKKPITEAEQEFFDAMEHNILEKQVYAYLPAARSAVHVVVWRMHRHAITGAT